MIKPKITTWPISEITIWEKASPFETTPNGKTVPGEFYIDSKDESSAFIKMKAAPDIIQQAFPKTAQTPPHGYWWAIQSKDNPKFRALFVTLHNSWFLVKRHPYGKEINNPEARTKLLNSQTQAPLSEKEKAALKIAANNNWLNDKAKILFNLELDREYHNSPQSRLSTYKSWKYFNEDLFEEGDPPIDKYKTEFHLKQIIPRKLP